MSFKVCFIGAGSLGFTRKLVRDLLIIKEFSDIEIAFHDIDADYLEKARAVIQKDIDSNGLNIKIFASTDRREALKGAKYVFNCVRIGGLEAARDDIEIPLRYGITQCYGDTLAAGGILYAQRGIIAMLEFCKDIRDVCTPDCIMLNYANPNAMITWAMNEYGKVKTIGLCHGVMYGRWQISEALGIPEKELDIICAGINHMTWYIQVKHNGKDMIPQLLDAFQRHPRFSKGEKLRLDMMKRLGYYVTESNCHASEYTPWYRKRPGDFNNWLNNSGDNTWMRSDSDKDSLNIDSQDTGAYLLDLYEAREQFEEEYRNLQNESPYEYTPENRGLEHGSYIVEGLETGRLYRGYFNVVNHGCIENLPADAVVEVPGYVDANGFNIPIVGNLPDGCAAACLSNITAQRLAVKAAVTGDDMLLRQAMMFDPLTGAMLTPPEIWQMVDEMLVAQKDWLPQYAEAIEKAEYRLNHEPRITPKKCVAVPIEHPATLEDYKEFRAKRRALKAAEEEQIKQAEEKKSEESVGLNELLNQTGFQVQNKDE